jgi:pilus assembly protein Flp/PilA
MLQLQALTLLRHGKLYYARLRDRQEGQALVEYSLILALISVVAIEALRLIGTDVNAVLGSVTDALDSALPAG